MKRNRSYIWADGDAIGAAEPSLLVRQQQAINRARDLAAVVQELRQERHISLRQIAAGLNKPEIAAPREGIWQVGQVAGLMKRLQEA